MLPMNIPKSLLLLNSNQVGNNSFGTCFVIHKTDDYVIAVTCAHVISRIGGSGNIHIKGGTVEVVACGSESGPVDLAVLRIKGLSNVEAMRLGVAKETDRKLTVHGFQSHYIDRGGYIYKPVKVTIDSICCGIDREQNHSVETLELKTENDQNLLQGGHSGSPVVNDINNRVIGIMTYEKNEGKQGGALSTDSIKEIWPEISTVFTKDAGKTEAAKKPKNQNNQKKPAGKASEPSKEERS
jgi:hypothetical protein